MTPSLDLQCPADAAVGRETAFRRHFTLNFDQSKLHFEPPKLFIGGNKK